MLFVDLKPEIEDEFEKNYRRTVVKSLKNIRREITQKFVSIFLTVKLCIIIQVADACLNKDLNELVDFFMDSMFCV